MIEVLFEEESSVIRANNRKIHAFNSKVAHYLLLQFLLFPHARLTDSKTCIMFDLMDSTPNHLKHFPIPVKILPNICLCPAYLSLK